MEAVTKGSCRVMGLNTQRALMKGKHVIELSLKIKAIVQSFVWEYLIITGKNDKVSLLKYNYFYPTDYVCTRIGGQNLGWIPDFCLSLISLCPFCYLSEKCAYISYIA